MEAKSRQLVDRPLAVKVQVRNLEAEIVRRCNAAMLLMCERAAYVPCNDPPQDRATQN